MYGTVQYATMYFTVLYCIYTVLYKLKYMTMMLYFFYFP